MLVCECVCLWSLLTCIAWNVISVFLVVGLWFLHPANNRLWQRRRHCCKRRKTARCCRILLCSRSVWCRVLNVQLSVHSARVERNLFLCCFWNIVSACVVLWFGILQHVVIFICILWRIVSDYLYVAQPGMLMVGVLKRKMDYGIFVNMLNNLTGLAPMKVRWFDIYMVPSSPWCQLIAAV